MRCDDEHPDVKGSQPQACTSDHSSNQPLVTPSSDALSVSASLSSSSVSSSPSSSSSSSSLSSSLLLDAKNVSRSLNLPLPAVADPDAGDARDGRDDDDVPGNGVGTGLGRTEEDEMAVMAGATGACSSCARVSQRLLQASSLLRTYLNLAQARVRRIF